MKTRYATTIGIYDESDFDGPPPVFFIKVVDAKDVEELIRTLQEYLALNSTDGKPERQFLRQKLKSLIQA